MRHTFFHIFCIFALILASCTGTNTPTVTTSSETEISNFYFASQDSFPSIGTTKFTISLYSSQDTALITNADSMTYLTPVNRLVPRFTFKATPSSTVVVRNDSIIALSGRDTLDFTDPVMIRVISSDMKNTKFYRIQVNVHQVDPDLFVWERLSDAVIAQGTASTQGLVLNDRFYMFANDGFTTRVYQSADGRTWDNGSTPEGLPANCRVKEIIAANGDHTGQDVNTLYYCQDGTIYTSTDAIHWQTSSMSDADYTPRVMLMHFNDSVWLVAEHTANHTFHLAVQDNDTWRANAEPLPNEWPIADFATVEFRSSSDRHRAMIVGGYDTEGNSLNSRWNIEFSPVSGYRYANFAIQRPLCSAILGASVVHYGKRFYLFGGTDADAQYISSTALYSDDEGLNWFPIDTVHNHLMDVYSQRTQSNAMVHNNCIYLFGGQTRTESYSDVLKGRLTSIDW